MTKMRIDQRKNNQLNKITKTSRENSFSFEITFYFNKKKIRQREKLFCLFLIFFKYEAQIKQNQTYFGVLKSNYQQKLIQLNTIVILHIQIIFYCNLSNTEMNFLNHDFDHLTQDDQKYRQNFQDSYSCCPRYSFLYHCLRYLINVKSQINQLPPNRALTPDNLQEIRPDDTSVVLSKNISGKYQEMVNEHLQGQPFNDSNTFSVVWKTYKREILISLVLFHIDAFFRIAFTVLLLELFQDVEANNRTMAYVWIAILTVLWYLSQLFKELALNRSYLMATRIKSGLAMLLYAKLSKMTSFVLNSSEQISKITNLIANDLCVLEARAPILINALAFPFLIICVTIVLILRVGLPALAGLGVILIFIPIMMCISNKNREILTTVNGLKDKRITITTQTIEGIKQVKANCWQEPFKKFIEKTREVEVGGFKKLAFGRAIQRGIGKSLAFASALVIFVTEYSIGDLTTPLIFSVMEMAALLNMAAISMVLGIGLYFETRVVFNRFATIISIAERSMIHIDRQPKKTKQSKQELNVPVSEANLVKGSHQFLYSPMNNNLGHSRLHPRQIIEPKVKRGQVHFVDFFSYWKNDTAKPTLKNINYYFEGPKLYGITGKVGSGKSTLLAAILGEVPYYSGVCEKKGSIAYVEQEPIVFSETIRSNILFGRQFQKELYERAVRISCLSADFQKLANKDLTMIGQKGVTLSGGQKARIAIARAIYSQSDIILLDNVLSSVDSRIAKKIFLRCIKQLSKEKTVLFIAHRLTYLQQCDEIVVLQDGQISDQGIPEQVSAKLMESAADLKTSKLVEEQFQESSLNIKSYRTNQIQDSEQDMRESNADENEESEEIKFNEQANEVGCLTYCKFFFADKLNILLLPICLILFVLCEAVVVAFLRILGDFHNVQAGTSSTFQSDFRLFWWVLVILIVARFVVLVITYFVVNVCIVMNSTKLHQNMINFFVRARSSFFDTTPTGLLTNKFTTDLGVLDNSLVVAFIDSVQGPILVAVGIGNMIHINLWFIIPTIILAIIIILFFLYARPAFIACKQMDLQMKAPIFHFYSQTIHGLIQMKLYDRRLSKIRQFSEIINKNIRTAVGFDMVSRGFAFYESIFAIPLMTAGMVLGIHVLHHTNTGHYGVAVLYLIHICQALQFILRQIICTESFLVSAQRILQFESFAIEKDLRTDYDRQAGLSQELDAEEEGKIVKQEWPQHSTFEISNLSVSYRQGLPLVLNNISFNIEEGQKVAIVGKSGAGKSSVLLSLFRVVEPQQGCSYTIDGHNALEMGLHSLRKHISVIPQTPFLFKGTVRHNLDPFGIIPDEELWQALEQASLKGYVESFPNQLDTQITNGSQFFSLGQKQLVCLTRVLLRRNKILFLDEATSNLDMETDAFMQQVIRKRFKDTTVITIAHRLNTIADYDKVIVLNRGQIAEQGDPLELIRRGGPFCEMVKNTGKTETLRIMDSAIGNQRSKKKIN